MKNHEAKAAEQTQGPRTALTAHSPAPWRVVPNNNGCYFEIEDAKGNGIFESTFDNQAGVVSIEDARLIAAAPDLLAAHVENARILGFLVNELQGRIEGGKLGALALCLERSIAAIARATEPPK